MDHRMKVLAVIPARYLSTRLDKKLLKDICGKSMLQRVYEQCLKCDAIDKVMIAVDDLHLREEVLKFGAEVYFSTKDHNSGTDRIAELVDHEPDYDIVINVQGDEPFVNPEHIQLLINSCKTSLYPISTLIAPFSGLESPDNSNIVKVVKSTDGKALYFSRARIPYVRDENALFKKVNYFKHLGIYGFRRTSLLEISRLPPSDLESYERLEQLRWMEHGYNIQTVEVPFALKGVDTQEDLDEAIGYAKKHQL